MPAAFRHLLVFALLAGFSYAFSIEELRDLELGGLSEYPEIGGIRQNLLLSFYSSGKDNLPEGFGEFANASVAFMREFRDVHNLSVSGRQEDLLALPGRVGPALDSLGRMSEYSRDSIPLSKFSSYLAKTALGRFVSSEGTRLKVMGDSEPRTRRKLELYKAAADLFKGAGNNIKAAEITATYDSINADYVGDMEEADRIFEETEETCEASLGDLDALFGLKAYAGLRRCIDGLLSARGIYAAHIEYEKLHELDSLVAVASGGMDEVSGKVTGFFFFASALFVTLNVLMISRLRRWYGDNYDASLGSEVLRWGRRD